MLVASACHDARNGRSPIITGLTSVLALSHHYTTSAAIALKVALTATSLIGFTLNTAKTVGKYIKSVKNALESARVLSEEVTCLKQTLFMLKRNLNTDFSQITFPATLVLVLSTKACQQRLDKLNEALEPVVTGNLGFRVRVR